MPTFARTQPYGAFNYSVSVINSPAAFALEFTSIGFMEISGLDGEVSPMEYRDSAIPAQHQRFPIKIPGLEQYPNVVLRRGLTGDDVLWRWRNAVRDRGNEPDIIAALSANIEIRLMTETNDNATWAMRWRLMRAWPCRISGPTLNARTNEIAVESVELCCERISMVED